jgi:hypothetical protein
MRNLTNYIQVITTTMAYNLRFPDYFKNLFYPLEKAGASSGIILSFD